MANSRIPLVLALKGQPDKLVSKPDTYAELLQLARRPNIFSDPLQDFKDEEITFRFKWDNMDVDLDHSAFDFVHARSRLRIITPNHTFSIRSEYGSKSPGTPVTSEPLSQRAKFEGTSLAKDQDTIDLTESDAAPASPQQGALVVQDGLAGEGQITGATQKLELIPPPRLVAHNFDVNTASSSPRRRPIPQQWVNCREPWSGDEKPSNPRFAKFPLRIFTEHHVMPCVFTSGLVHLGTLKKFLKDRGYPTSTPKIRRSRPYVEDDTWPLHCWFSKGADVHVFKSKKPGLYLLPAVNDWGNSLAIPRVSVVLKLKSGVNLESIYPWTEVKSLDGIEKAKWKVSIDDFGNAVCKSGSDEYSGHISWETKINTTSDARSDGILGFGPAKPILTPQNSVVLHREFFLGAMMDEGPEDDYLQQSFGRSAGTPGRYST